jgi:hypothetical protein
MDKKDTRYPYTYACDLIRSFSGYDREGCCLSRANASRIQEIVAKIIGMPDEKLAKKLADYYLEHEDELTDASTHELLLNQEYYRERE